MKPVVIFAGAGACERVVHEALEWKLSGGWIAISLSEACNATCRVLEANVMTLQAGPRMA